MALKNSIPEIFNRDQMPNILYHYTSIEGFFGIVRDAAVRASDFKYVNDYDEVLHLIRDVLPNCKGLDNEIVEKFQDIFAEKNLHTNELIPNYLIASFSECEDDIAMWGRYTADNGVALGFDSGTIELGKPVNDSFQMPTIGKCLYKTEDKVTIAQRVLDEYISKHSRSFDEYFFVELAVVLLRLGPFFKNQSFSNEREWRVVLEHLPSGDTDFGRPDFRISGPFIVPYFGLSFLKFKEGGTPPPERMYISRIVLSPKAKRNYRIRGSMEDYLKAYKVGYGEFVESESNII